MTKDTERERGGGKWSSSSSSFETSYVTDWSFLFFFLLSFFLSVFLSFHSVLFVPLARSSSPDWQLNVDSVAYVPLTGNVLAFLFPQQCAVFPCLSVLAAFVLFFSVLLPWLGKETIKLFHFGWYQRPGLFGSGICSNSRWGFWAIANPNT